MYQSCITVFVKNDMGLGFFSTVPGFFWHVLGMRDLGWIFSFVSGFFVVDVSCGFHFDRGVQLVCRSCVQTLRLCVCVCDCVVHASGRCVKPCCRDSG